MDHVTIMNYATKLADSFMQERGLLSDQWEHEHGILLKGILDLWKYTKEQNYFEYLEKSISPLILDEGTIIGYNLQDYLLDNIVSGNVLFDLYKETNDEKYKKAIYNLKEQLKTHPQASFGNYLHKGFLKDILLIDSTYMGMPFYAQFENEFGEGNYDIVVKSIQNAFHFNYNQKSGLLYHGYNETKSEKWADVLTGNSSTFWGRGLGWYLAGIIDVLDFLPSNHSGYNKVKDTFKKTIQGILRYQDISGTWYQVIDQIGREGNYLEASASAMFTYCLAKGMNRGYLSKSYKENTMRAYEGLINEFITINDDGSHSLMGTCASAGLGVKEYRDGSFESYANEATKTNDLKGVGVFLMASVEMAKLMER